MTWWNPFSGSEKRHISVDERLIERSRELEIEQATRVVDLQITGRQGRQQMIQQALDIRNRRDR